MGSQVSVYHCTRGVSDWDESTLFAATLKFSSLSKGVQQALTSCLCVEQGVVAEFPLILGNPSCMLAFLCYSCSTGIINLALVKVKSVYSPVKQESEVFKTLTMVTNVTEMKNYYY